MNEHKVTRKNGKVAIVKNMGWLLRHWKDIENFEVSCITTGKFPQPTVLLKVYGDRFCNWSTFETGWASAECLRDWLNRPVFKGVEIDWFAQSCNIGDKVYINLPTGAYSCA